MVHDIGERLVRELPPAVPPGRVLAYTLRVERRLRAVSLDPESRRVLIEGTVRQQLGYA